MAPDLQLSPFRRTLALAVLLAGSFVLLATSPKQWEKQDSRKLVLRDQAIGRSVSARVELPQEVLQRAREVTVCATASSNTPQEPARLVLEAAAGEQERVDARFEQQEQGPQAHVCTFTQCQHEDCTRPYSIRIEPGPSRTASYRLELTLVVQGRYPEPKGDIRLVVR